MDRGKHRPFSSFEVGMVFPYKSLPFGPHGFIFWEQICRNTFHICIFAAYQSRASHNTILSLCSWVLLCGCRWRVAQFNFKPNQPMLSFYAPKRVIQTPIRLNCLFNYGCQCSGSNCNAEFPKSSNALKYGKIRWTSKYI